MIGVHRPTVLSYCIIKASAFDRLDVARVAGPANRLQIVDVIKQIKIALVWLQVVNNSSLGVFPAALQESTASLVLAFVRVTQQCPLTQNFPLLSVVQLPVLSSLWCAPFIHRGSGAKSYGAPLR